jgi:fructokinase
VNRRAAHAARHRVDERTGSPAVPTIVCWGELVWDLLPDGPRLGGCAANVAYHAARLGNRSVLVSRVGQDPLGQAALSILAAAGVDVSLVGVDRDAPTGSVRVDLRRDEPRYELVTQAAWNRIELTAGVAAAIGTAAVGCYGVFAQQTALRGDALAAALASMPPSCVRLCDLNLRSPTLRRADVDAALAGADEG